MRGCMKIKEPVTRGCVPFMKPPKPAKKFYRRDILGKVLKAFVKGARCVASR